MSVVIRGGTVVTPTGEAQGDVVVGDDGRIAAVVDAGTASASGVVTIDAGGLLVLPGMIDAHVHFDEPGRADWEGFDTGSAAAAAGGVTTVVDMPIDCDPPTVSAAAVFDKAAAIRRHSRVDVAMWGGLVPGSVGALDSMLDAGVIGFKAFACPSGWDDFPATDQATLATGFAFAASAGVPVAVHCELAEMGHTPDSEVAAVRWAAGLARQAGARLHVVHASAAAAVDEARRWPNVTVETCPHYLVLDSKEAVTIGPAARCSPPIRSAANREALWDRLLGGEVDCVASDHSPCPPALRQGSQPWSGIDGVGMVLPLLLSSGRLPLGDVVRVTTAAARILGLPGKGAIEPGYHADLTLVDQAATWSVSSSSLWSRHRGSPYIGRSLRGRVEMTLVRGRQVFSASEGPSPGAGGQVVTGRH
jgi:allantoinase